MASQRELQRKEITLTYDQFDTLDLLARRLNRQRDKSAEGAEAITTSALVRCAIEVFLAAEGQISGNNEEEVLKSYLVELSHFFTKYLDQKPKQLPPSSGKKQCQNSLFEPL